MNREEIKQLVRQALSASLTASSATAASGLDNAPVIASQKMQDATVPTVYHAPWTGSAYEAHPSQERFMLSEAAETRADLREFGAPSLCTIEKNRACDHCGICQARGF